MSVGGFLHWQQVLWGDTSVPGWLYRISAPLCRFSLRLGRRGEAQTCACLLVLSSSLFSPVFRRIRGATSHSSPHGAAWSRLGTRACSWNWVLHVASGASSIWPRGAGQPCSGLGNQWPGALPQRQDVCPLLGGHSGVPSLAHFTWAVGLCSPGVRRLLTGEGGTVCTLRPAVPGPVLGGAR